jgi:hypothetical protein
MKTGECYYQKEYYHDDEIDENGVSMAGQLYSENILKILEVKKDEIHGLYTSIYVNGGIYCVDIVDLSFSEEDCELISQEQYDAYFQKFLEQLNDLKNKYPQQ